MGKKFKILLLLISLSLTLGLMSNTYSRYVANTTGDVELAFAKWQILLNNEDVTNGLTSTLDITPVIEENQNIENNTIAPSSKGYFDVNIDPSNVGVSFNYSIDLKILNEDIPDIMITKYAILDEYSSEESEITTVNVENNSILGTMNFDNFTENFNFNPFTVRIYFEWYEGANEQMNDAEDSLVGNDATVNDTKLQIEATINFEQKI